VSMTWQAMYVWPYPRMRHELPQVHRRDQPLHQLLRVASLRVLVPVRDLETTD